VQVHNKPIIKVAYLGKQLKIKELLMAIIYLLELQEQVVEVYSEVNKPPKIQVHLEILVV